MAKKQKKAAGIDNGILLGAVVALAAVVVLAISVQQGGYIAARLSVPTPPPAVADQCETEFLTCSDDVLASEAPCFNEEASAHDACLATAATPAQIGACGDAYEGGNATCMDSAFSQIITLCELERARCYRRLSLPIPSPHPSPTIGEF